MKLKHGVVVQLLFGCGQYIHQKCLCWNVCNVNHNLNSRNMKMLPQTVGFIGTCIQILAFLCLLAPKIFLVASTLVFAPYVFSICYCLEYLMIITYNKIVKGSWEGKKILFSYKEIILNRPSTFSIWRNNTFKPGCSCFFPTSKIWGIRNRYDRI